MGGGGHARHCEEGHGEAHTHLAEADEAPLRTTVSGGGKGPLLGGFVEGAQHWRGYPDVGPHGWREV